MPTERDRPAPWVLYVGDRAVNIMLLEAIFERRPHLQLVVTSQGERALRLANSLRPALVLIDLEWDGGDARALLRALRDHNGCDMPVIALSADHDSDLTGTDFAELWGKPLGPRLVFERLDALTAGVEAARPAARAPARLQPDERPSISLH